jgi:excisionase family DNA binding protein
MQPVTTMSRKPNHIQPKTPRPIRDVPLHWLDKTELASYLNVSVSTISKYVHRRVIPFIKIPDSTEVRFEITDIDAWLRSGRVPTITEELNRQKEKVDANNQSAA